MANPTDPYHPKKYFGLNHLRAFAISFVLLFHYQFFGHPHWMEPVGKFGWTGVDLFFVLSGFLISSELFKELTKAGTISLKNFFIKRSFRILPAYLLVVAIYFSIPAFHEREALAPLWKYLTFTQNLGLDLSTQGTFSHAWSLCVEEQFYLLLPLALLLVFGSALKRKGVFILAIVALAGFAARAYNWYHIVAPHQDMDGFYIFWYKYIYYPIYTRLDGLLMGILISAMVHFRPLLFQKIAIAGNWLLVAGLVIIVIAYVICLDEHSAGATIFGFPVVAIGYGFIVMGAISNGSTLYKYRVWATEKLASLSYGIYLIHKGIIHLVQQYFNSKLIPKDSTLMFVFCLAFVIWSAWLLQLVVEKPFQRLRKRILKQS